MPTYSDGRTFELHSARKITPRHDGPICGYVALGAVGDCVLAQGHEGDTHVSADGSHWTVTAPTMSPSDFEDRCLNRVRANLFGLAFEAARTDRDEVARATSDFDATDVDTRFWLAADGRSGFAVTLEGELRFVFSTVRGRGNDIVRAAVDRGARHLDCFDGYLANLYARHGFYTTRRAPNWTIGGPDVVWMRLG